MKKLLLLLAMVCTSWAVELQLAPGAVLEDGVLTLKNDAYARVRNSSGRHALPNGMTISAAVKMNPRPSIKGSGLDENKKIIYSHDIIASKGGEFVFGRRSDAWVDQVYLNFQDGTEWKVPLHLGAKTHKYGTWAIWTVTMLPQIKAEEGRRCTLISIYVNGELGQSLEAPGVPDQNDLPILVGKGLGIANENWNYQGSIAELQIVDKALDEEEIQNLIGSSKLVRFSFKKKPKLSSELLGITEKLKRQASAGEKWMIDSLERAALNGYEQNILSDRLKNAGTLAELVKTWPALQCRENGKSQFLLLQGKGQGCFPLIGFREDGRELFGKYSLAWKLEGKLDKTPITIDSDCAWSCTPQGDNAWKITWNCPQNVGVDGNLFLEEGQVKCTLNVQNNNPRLKLKALHFPLVRVARKNQGMSYLVHPYQGGMLCPNPTESAPQAPGWYPCGAVTMQMGAYYDNASGVYISPEDENASMHRYSVRIRNGELDFDWETPVSHGRSLKNAGATIRTFQGDWYDAALLYRDFAASKGCWMKKRPVTTPQWFLENTFWLGHWTFKDSDIAAMPALMKGIRDYLEVPFAVHWYRWIDGKQGGWPHFHPRTGVLEANRDMLKNGIHTMAYIDSRLWSELDGPDNASDWQYSSRGKPAAIVNEDGSFNYERYRAACQDTVMCPSVPDWQQAIYDASKDVADAAFASVYHDQVAAARPYPCYSSKHGHPVNSPSAWKDGYYEMFRKIDALRQSYPELAHTTEDAADAYIYCFDGFLPWRWTQSSQIPLFTAVYGGKTQFIGRVYDNTCKGTIESHFVKEGTQLVNGEQLGWFTSSYFQRPDFAIYTKQLVHLRRLLLSYFNGGHLGRPIAYKEAPQMRTTAWGVAAEKPSDISMPAILSARWDKDSSKDAVCIFLNTSDVPQQAKVLGEAGFIACRMDGSCTAVELAMPLALPPHCFEIWSNNSSEARRIAAELKRFAAFDFGSLGKLFGILIPTPSHPAQVEALALSGQEGKTTQRKVSLKLKPSQHYKVSLLMRKDANAKGYCAIANYDARKKLKFYHVNGNGIPGDGEWHQLDFTFSTDADLNNCGFYLYNSKSTGTIEIKSMSIGEMEK